MPVSSVKACWRRWIRWIWWIRWRNWKVSSLSKLTWNIDITGSRGITKIKTMVRYEHVYTSWMMSQRTFNINQIANNAGKTYSQMCSSTQLVVKSNLIIVGVYFRVFPFFVIIKWRLAIMANVYIHLCTANHKSVFIELLCNYSVVMHAWELLPASIWMYSSLNILRVAKNPAQWG